MRLKGGKLDLPSEIVACSLQLLEMYQQKVRTMTHSEVGGALMALYKCQAIDLDYLHRLGPALCDWCALL